MLYKGVWVARGTNIYELLNSKSEEDKALGRAEFEATTKRFFKLYGDDNAKGLMALSKTKLNNSGEGILGSEVQ